MANWFNPPPSADRAASVAQIVADLNTYVVTGNDGNKTFDVDGFMALAATRLAAIPDDSSGGFVWDTPELLRSTNLRPYAETLRTDIEGISDQGDSDLAALLAALKEKSDAVTAYFDAAFATGIAAILNKSLSAGALDENIPAAEEINPQTTYYIVTFVTDREEESEPSPVSDALEVGTKDTVTITRPTVPGSRNISYWRVYRSNSGNRGAAFQYTPTTNNPDLGVLVATGTFVDSAKASNLQEVCPSMTWAEPPATLRGLTGMANGILAGFFKDTVCFCEAYQFHAWPEEYQVTVEFPIVGLMGVDQTLFVGTRANPYLITGADPQSMTARKLDSNQACVSARSICATKYGVVYASPDGLCLCTLDGNVRILTIGLFTKEEWDQLAPENMIVAESDGVLYISTDAPTGGSWQWEIMALGIQSVLNGNGSWGGSGNFAIVLAPTPHDLGFGGVISSVTDVGIGQAIDNPDNLIYPDGSFTPNRYVSGSLISMPSMYWSDATYVRSRGETACQSSGPPKACVSITDGTTLAQVKMFDFLTGTLGAAIWQGTFDNDAPSPAFHSAWDSVNSKVAVIANDSASTRDDKITVLPGATLSDKSIVTPTLAGWPARFAMYDGFIYVPTAPVSNGGGTGVLSLYKYSASTGALVSTIGGSGVSNATAARYMCCANEHGVFVLDNVALDITNNRNLWKVTDAGWTLLASDVTYDNTSSKTTTFWCDGKVLIVGPTGVNVGGAGANNVLYRIYRIAAGTGVWKATGYNSPWTVGQPASGTGWFWGYSGTTPIVVRHGPWIAQNALTATSETGSSLPPPVETA